MPEQPAERDPLTDPARLAATRRIVAATAKAGDVPEWSGLDRLTALAAELLGVPSAQVSLLTEEQLVPSAVGDAGRGSSPAEDSLCTVTLRRGGPLVLPDTGAEPLVRDLPPVRSGAVGSYCGVPLVLSDGQALGALCAFDSAPRAWSDRDVAVLEGLAASAVAELELRALTSEMVTKAAQLDLALSAADIGSFDLHVDSGRLVWDDRLVRLFGYERDAFGGTLEDFNARLHPDDLPRISAAIERALETVGDLSVEYRVVRADSTRWVEARGRALPGPDGRAERLLGVAYDSTELRATRDRLARVLETMGDAFYSLDADWCFTYVNAEAENLLQRRSDELVGRSIWQEFPGTAASGIEAHYREAVQTGEPVSFEVYYPPLDGWFDIRCWPTPDGLSVYFRNVTLRRRDQQEREQAVVERERAYAEAEAANRRLQLLADASHALAQSLEPAEVLQTLSSVLLPELGRWVVVALVADAAGPLLGRELPGGDTQLHVVHADHVDASRLPELHRLLEGLPVTTSDPVGAGAVVRTGRPEWLPEVPDEALRRYADGDAAVLSDLRALVPGSALTAPLVSRGRRLGAVTVAEPANGSVDRALVSDMVARAAVALDNALAYGVERRTGLTLQNSLLPGEVPKLPGLEVAVRYEPGATGAHVGGDWYQGVVVGDELLLCMGDVMGHGMQSAARMGQLRAIVATLALEGHGPGALLRRLADNSEALLDLELATVLVARYRPADRVLTVASAGHPPPLLAPPDAEPAYVDVVPGPPIGSLPGEYPEVQVDVPALSTLVLYTDGLVEDRGVGLDVGLERLRQALVELRLPPEAVADHVLAALGRTHGADDDVALLVLSHLADDAG